jgi:DNA-directed RNA polymerase subunit H (RpoH/RPB5)
VNDKAGLQHNHVRNHRIVDRVGVFGDVEIFLNDTPWIGEKGPVSAYSAAVFVRLGDVVGTDRAAKCEQKCSACVIAAERQSLSAPWRATSHCCPSNP